MGCSTTEEQKPFKRSEKRRVTNSKNKDVRKSYEFIRMLEMGLLVKVCLYRDKIIKNYFLL